MGWIEVVFEREKLYAEVWQEAVSKVAPRYQLSDVGLRKICKKLDIPLPPLGYWAKLQHGKAVTRPPLPPSSTSNTYRMSKYDDSATVLRRQKVKRLVAETKPTQTELVTLRSDIAECLPAIRRMSHQFKKGVGDRDVVVLTSESAFDVVVSKAAKDRALLLLNGIIEGCLARGYSLHAPKEGGAAYVEIEKVKLTFAIGERFQRSERPLTETEKRERREAEKRNGYFYYRDRWIFTPSGELTLKVLDAIGKWRRWEIKDGASRPIEDRLLSIPDRLLELAIERKLIWEERKQEQVASEERQRLARQQQQLKEAALKQLETVEKQAKDWQRAQLLRSYAESIADQGGPSESVAWIQNAADWLDPMTRKHWPDVDGTVLKGRPEQ